MFANVFMLGYLVVAVLSGVLSVDVDNVKVATTLAASLDTQATVWLKMEEPTTPNKFLCSASIIDRAHVLVHATCIEYYKSDKLEIARGLVNLTTTETFYPVKGISYEEGTHMAIIKTDENTFETTSIVVLSNKALSTISECYISGWLDETTAWQQYPVRYVDDADCKAQNNPKNTPVEDGSVCAYYLPSQNCWALGMPLTCDDQLTGLFSQAYWECNLPGQCTGVPHSKAWIVKQLTGGVSNLQPSLLAAITAILVAHRSASL